MRLITITLALCPTIATAETDTLTSMQKASDLGNIIGSETLCGLTLDQAGIEAWISANVAKDDMSFASHLSATVGLSEYKHKDMTASAKTAHCAAVKQSATAAGLIK